MVGIKPLRSTGCSFGLYIRFAEMKCHPVGGRQDPDWPNWVRFNLIPAPSAPAKITNKRDTIPAKFPSQSSVIHQKASLTMGRVGTLIFLLSLSLAVLIPKACSKVIEANSASFNTLSSMYAVSLATFCVVSVLRGKTELNIDH